MSFEKIGESLEFVFGEPSDGKKRRTFNPPGRPDDAPKGPQYRWLPQKPFEDGFITCTNAVPYGDPDMREPHMRVIGFDCGARFDPRETNWTCPSCKQKCYDGFYSDMPCVDCGDTKHEDLTGYHQDENGCKKVAQVRYGYALHPLCHCHLTNPMDRAAKAAEFAELRAARERREFRDESRSRQAVMTQEYGASRQASEARQHQGGRR